MAQEELLNQEIFAAVPPEKLALQSREDLITFIKLQQEVNESFRKRVIALEAYVAEMKQQALVVGESYVLIKNKFFGKSSEKEPREGDGNGDSDSTARPKTRKVLLPSERYPDAPLIERRVEFGTMPACNCCGATMADSGMSEESEFLTVIPEQYLVIRQMRQKVRCEKCYGDIKTAPAPDRIKEGSAYSDEMIVDVAMTKYCDLIPIERYTAMAGREGLDGLPPHSLIETTHYLADFVEGAYAGLRAEILKSEVLHADETPHRMLEGDKKSHWQLWGFSTPSTSYFECHSTRSGDVASDLLVNASCRYLVSDVFSGYGKAVRETNEMRTKEGKPDLRSVFCNAHARRKFKEGSESYPDEAKFFIDCYKEIYRLEGLAKEKPPDEVLALRAQMTPHFEDMRERVIAAMGGYSSKSSIAVAMNYFLKNYEGFTRFLKNAVLPIDNNPQERQMRNPVIGRKTWYGTHSKRGAKTASILFSLVESCKLNRINPRTYFKSLVDALHRGESSFTPRQFAARPLAN